MYASDYAFDPDNYSTAGTGTAMSECPDSIQSTPPAQPPATDEADQADPRDIGLPMIVELLLKDRRRLFRVLRNPRAPAVLMPRLLAIALVGFALSGVTMSLVLSVANVWPSLTALATWIDAPSSVPLSFEAIDSRWGGLAPWIGGDAFVLVAAYAFGLVASSGVCLPSLYFYSLLAGVRMTMLDVVVHAVNSKAVSAVMLVGIVPIYVAVAMGVVIFDASEFYRDATMFVGLALPFIAGISGTVSLYHGFSQLCDTMPLERMARRKCFLRRLVLSWSACYSAVMPVMIYSVWEVFSRM